MTSRLGHLKRYVGSGCLLMTALIAVTGCSKSNEQVIASVAPTDEVVQTTSEVEKKEEEPVVEEKTYLELYEETGQLPHLYEVYEDSFSVGVALAQQDIKSAQRKALVTSQFNSITCENEMKPDFTLDRQATLANGDEERVILNMSRADDLLTFAQENGLKMRGHTLVWHSQTPRWFFTVGYDVTEDAPLVSREVMLTRLENYIKDQMDYVNTTYPGVVYAWDVVNEAIAPGEGHAEGLRMEGSYWYEVLGDDYVERAFEFARKYAAEDQKLFYNDYGTYEKDKLLAIYNLASELKEKGLIDGIGMQSHIQISYPTASDYEYAIKKYGELGLEIQITELDIDAKENTDEELTKLATRYKRIMMSLLMLEKNELANITNVTLWGLTDDRSWLNNDTPSWPLVFDSMFRPKAAYFGILRDDSVPLY